MRDRRHNDYLSRRIERMRDNRSRGGYSRRDNMMDTPRRDYRDYGNDYGYNDYNNYPNYDYRDYGRRNRDYRSDYADMEDEYKKDLKEWIEKLKRDDRFRVSKEQVIEQARNMGIQFRDFDEDELYATYLMMISDYKNVVNDWSMYLSMAKDFLQDDDAELKGSDKLCTYMYEIVMGE